MYLADTLSRAFIPEVNACNFSSKLEAVDHKEYLSVSEEHLQQISHASADDSVLQQQRAIILQGWPESKSGLPECLYIYFDHRDTLTTHDKLVFKGQLLVAPACLRKEMMTVVHSIHIGIDSCIRRARESLYWPRMSTELQEYISKCDICLAERNWPGQRTTHATRRGNSTLVQARCRSL